jgi:LuxR family transcriptional regulator, maltose regulon positive regulatory protein
LPFFTGRALVPFDLVGHFGGRGVRFEPPTGGYPNLVRQRLLDMLRQRFVVPLTLVAAPAGFGKTTLLAQAADENRLAPEGADCWLTCHAEDSTASSLTEGICRALDAAPPDSDAANAAIAAIGEAMWHRSPHEVALVLDDVHEITSGSAGAEMLAGLLASLPRNGHVVLSGRMPLPVPIARLVVQGRVLQLGEAELRFTDDELAEFAEHRNVPRGRVAPSGGWPALAEIAASAQPGVQTAYVWEEVIAAIDPQGRRDLALLAHVDSFDEALAAAIVGHHIDLDSLFADLPLVGRTSSGDRSIHSLWRPVLARLVSDAEVAAARRRAGIELVRTGHVAGAVRLLTQADAWDDVTSAVAGSLGAARPPVPGDVVAAWLGQLPESRRATPLGRLLDAVSSVQSDPEVAARRLGEAAASFRDDSDIDGELACIAQLAQLAWWSERLELMGTIVTRVLEMDAAGHPQAAPFAGLARALVADLANDSATTLAQLDRIPAGSLNETWQSLVDWLRSTSLNHLGRPAEALAAAEEASALAGPLHAPLVATSRLQALWYLGDVDAMVEGLPRLVDRTAAGGLRNYAAVMAATCCAALAAVGQTRQAAHYLERARLATAARTIPLVDVNLVIAEAVLAVALDDEASAAQDLRAYLDRSPLLGAGHAPAPQQRSLALWYVLVPETREIWEAAPLGPSFAAGRDLARAVVAIRAGGRARPPTTRLPSTGVVRAHLPLPWAVELALATIAEGGHAGWDLLDALWPAAQTHVRRYAEGEDRTLSGAARAVLARLPVPPVGRLELRLLGPVELRRDGTPVDSPEWRRGRVRSLLAYLVLQRSVTRERVAADLWPGLDSEAGSRNLRITLSYLLRVLEPDRSDRDASFFVRSQGTTLLLEPGEWLDADIWRFDDLWRHAREADREGAPSVALAAMREAVDLWRGDPSELATDQWAVGEVEERRLRLADLANRTGELLLAKGEPAAARRVAQVTLGIDPWSERAHYVVISADIAEGNHRAAQQALRRYQDAMHELGVDTSASASLVERLTRRLQDTSA